MTRPPPTQKTPLTFLSTSGFTLPKLYRKAQILLRLQGYLVAALDEPLNAHCRVANWREGCLIIAVDSAAWATLIRYATPDLLTHLRKLPELRSLRTIQHYVEPQIATPDAQPPQSRLSLSPQNALLMKSLADSISDNRLANALKRLARRGKV